MNELTGAVALAQVRKIDAVLERTRRAQRIILEGLRQLIDGAGHAGDAGDAGDVGDAGAPFTVRTVPDAAGDAGIAVGLRFDAPQTAAAYQAALRAEGVPLSTLYGGRPVYVLPQLQTLRPVWTNGAPLLRQGSPSELPAACPRTEALLAATLVLSVTPDYSTEDAADVVRAVRKVLAGLRRRPT
jgi:8-amino-3,8-dideoxy-alpha-D-manno-octulosonate transaminase